MRQTFWKIIFLVLIFPNILHYINGVKQWCFEVYQNGTRVNGKELSLPQLRTAKRWNLGFLPKLAGKQSSSSGIDNEGVARGIIPE